MSGRERESELNRLRKEFLSELSFYFLNYERNGERKRELENPDKERMLI